jgi:hypothetical protein
MVFEALGGNGFHRSVELIPTLVQKFVLSVTQYILCGNQQKNCVCYTFFNI